MRVGKYNRSHVNKEMIDTIVLKVITKEGGYYCVYLPPVHRLKIEAIKRSESYSDFKSWHHRDQETVDEIKAYELKLRLNDFVKDEDNNRKRS